MVMFCAIPTSDAHDDRAGKGMSISTFIKYLYLVMFRAIPNSDAHEDRPDKGMSISTFVKYL